MDKISIILMSALDPNQTLEPHNRRKTLQIRAY